MRAGTQTLIQAIQAIPWADDADNDDEAIPPTSMSESDSSDEEEEQGGMLWHPRSSLRNQAEVGSGAPLASSIHTIHRPIARSRKHERERPVISKRRDGSRTPGHFTPLAYSEDDEDSLSAEDEDFEATPVITQRSQCIEEIPMDEETAAISTQPGRNPDFDRMAMLRRSMTRTSSLATVRIKRRTRLADKLKDIFGLNEIREVIAGMSCVIIRNADLAHATIELPCWLLRSICA